MGTINVYNTLNAKHEEITANGRLKDIFPDINLIHCALKPATAETVLI